jgi:hypothetical protein
MAKFVQHMLGFQTANCTLMDVTYIDNQKNFTGSEEDRVNTELQKLMSIQSRSFFKSASMIMYL